ncbi:MAG: 30S ribosomal protein S9 [archaeon]
MKIVHVSGKRKKAIARATIREGKGLVRINNNLLGNYNPVFARDKIMEPLILAGDISKKIKLDVNVRGGGWRSQSEAIRLAIARAIVEFTQDKRIEKAFLDYDRQLLVADIRRKEQRKPNDSKARAKRQKSYR